MTGPLVVFHGGCVDGFTAAWVCYLKYGEDADYHPAFYGEGSWLDLPDVTGRDVLFVDICGTKEQMDEVVAAAASVKVIDHHVSREEVTKSLGGVYDVDRSGAGLAWDELMAKDLPASVRPWLVSYVEDRDLWRFELLRSKEISAYIATQEHTFENWSRMSDLGGDNAAKLGEGALAYLDSMVRKVSKLARQVEWHGYQVLVVNMDYMGTSEVVGHLAEQEGIDFAVGWFQRADETYQYGLRSRGDGPDVSEIAAKYGGGGHAKASGFTVNERVL